MQGQPRRDREWEHWPGRKPADDGIRHRLKALFAATEDEEAVEALISARGRELEEQTERLETAIAELERREEQAARLRASVEEMLRHGSAELDERQAELAALADEIREREEKVREQERELTLRTQELGAVELRRAAVERREQAVTEREGTLESLVAETGVTEIRPGAAGLPAAHASADAGLDLSAHLLYVSGDGYQLVEGEGAPPELDATVEIDGTAYVVTRVGRSTLPGDRRACAYVERARD